jgi:hypothetical protein
MKIKLSKLKELVAQSLGEFGAEEIPNTEPKGALLPEAEEEITAKFPELERTLERLMTDDYKTFIKTIDYVAPRPTMFRVVLNNDQTFFLKWMGEHFQAQIEGVRYELDNIAQFEQALDSLGDLFKYGPVPVDQSQQITPPGETPSAASGGVGIPTQIPTGEEGEVEGEEETTEEEEAIAAIPTA